jgi:glycosyltransferase involved in cell wall biosynthesis
VLPEVTGLLIPPGYPEAISESVLQLLSDPQRCRRMGKAARAWVLTHYVNDRVLHRTVRYYKSLLDRNLQRNPGRRSLPTDSVLDPI